MEISIEENAKLQNALDDFRKAIEIRNTINLRVARRVTAILRLGMISFAMVAIILLVMLYSFTSKMEDMIVALDTMNEKFSLISQDMTTMKLTLSGMNKNISSVPNITLATKNMNDAVGRMHGEIRKMDSTIAGLKHELHGITGHVDGMTWQIRTLDPAVQNMGGDVYRMSGPMRMFNMFFPMN